MINRFKRGLTTEQASLLAMGLERFNSLKAATDKISKDLENHEYSQAELTNPYIDNKNPFDSYFLEKSEDDWERLQQAKLINEALLDEVSIACEWHDYISGEVNLYIHEIIPEPRNETLLEVFQIRRMAPDEEYSFCPIPSHTTITKISLAKWFYNHMPDKANLFDPTESYKTTKTGYSLSDYSSNSSNSIVPEETLEKYSFPVTTKKLEAMVKAQKHFWSNYNQENLPSQKAISIFIAEDLGLTLTKNGTNRTADELAKAIQPDEIKRK